MYTVAFEIDHLNRGEMNITVLEKKKKKNDFKENVLLNPALPRSIICNNSLSNDDQCKIRTYHLVI